jgi:hypothetical protein
MMRGYILEGKCWARDADGRGPLGRWGGGVVVGAAHIPIKLHVTL